MSAAPGSAPARREIILQPTRGFRLAPWRELWDYRDLLRVLVWRDIAARYKQTILGPIWFLMQPLLNTVVFTLLFARVAHLSTSGVPGPLFYYCGLLLWNYFATSFNQTAQVLAINGQLFSKVYFPRLIVPLSGVISNLVATGIQLVLFIGFYVAYKQGPAAGTFGVSPWLALAPLVVLQVAAFSLGIGLWLAAFSVRFRDLSMLAQFIVQLWMYATPVVYPLSQLPPHLRRLAPFNPMTMPVEFSRTMLLGTPPPSLYVVGVTLAMTALTLVTGLMVFSRAEKTFVDVA